MTTRGVSLSGQTERSAEPRALRAPSVDDTRIGALVRLLEALQSRGYRFVTPSRSTHRRVLRRPDKQEALCLRDVFGWNLPFRAHVVDKGVLDVMRSAGVLEERDEYCTSKIRVSSLGNDLFLHSSFTAGQDAVFFGPDSYRFAAFLRAEIPIEHPCEALADIGTGSGVGAIVAARACRPNRIVLTDINPLALEYAKASAILAGLTVECVMSSGLAKCEEHFDLVVANPPFIADEGGPTYRDGGDMHGARISLDWAREAAKALSPEGRLLLYTGSAIVEGRDEFYDVLQQEFSDENFGLEYREIDPDIFGGQLASPLYSDVERIAAVGVKLERRRTDSSIKQGLEGAKKYLAMVVAGTPP